MVTLRINCMGVYVQQLQFLLNKFAYNLKEDGVFGRKTYEAVIDFQTRNGLKPDGIVGQKTWSKLGESCMGTSITEAQFEEAARIIGCDTAAVKAVQKVETNSRGGFFEPGKPAILFEGHIFWKQLKNVGINPETVQKSHPSICFPKWDKSHYLGGIREYERLEEAKSVNEEAALKSASYGMFQIMGFNFEACGCRDVFEMVKLSSESEFEQLKLFINFIKSNGLGRHMINHNWAAFAKAYNGPGYADNKYDIKLEQAYKEYC